jgi:hypothetical protein
MITREEIRKIIEESSIRILFSDAEKENIVEELYNRYANNNKYINDISDYRYKDYENCELIEIGV